MDNTRDYKGISDIPSFTTTLKKLFILLIYSADIIVIWIIHP